MIAEAAVKAAADDLGSLKPPSDATADNTAIVTALRAIQSALERVKANPTAAAAIVSTASGIARAEGSRRRRPPT